VPRSFPVAAPVTPRTFDIAADGRVVGVISRDTTFSRGQAASIPQAVTDVTVVLNWFEELKAKVPK